MACQWFFPGTLVFSTNKADRHDITVILLKVALNTIIPMNLFYSTLSEGLGLVKILYGKF
jgi:hypothetical protein